MRLRIVYIWLSIALIVPVATPIAAQTDTGSSHVTPPWYYAPTHEQRFGCYRDLFLSNLTLTSDQRRRADSLVRIYNDTPTHNSTKEFRQKQAWLDSSIKALGISREDSIKITASLKQELAYFHAGNCHRH